MIINNRIYDLDFFENETIYKLNIPSQSSANETRVN